MITGTSSGMGGMINSLVIRNVTDYSKCLQMLYKLEHYTKKLFYLSLENFYSSYLSFSSSSPAMSFLNYTDIVLIYKQLNFQLMVQN